jgi:DNA-binding FadR family transcriptional regulator
MNRRNGTGSSEHNATISQFRPSRVSTKSAAEQISEQIRTAITAGTFHPGDRLPSEQEMAAEFGVSRAAVREAIKLLTASQLLESTRGARGGTFIALPKRAVLAESVAEAMALWFQHGNISLSEVQEARAGIERLCVRFAAERRTEDDLEAMRTAIDLGRDPALDQSRFSELDLAFHSAISTASANKILELAMAPIHMVRAQTNRLVLPALDRERVLSQHVAIYAAIRDQDPDRAEEALAEHVGALAEASHTVLGEREVPAVRVEPFDSEAWIRPPGRDDVGPEPTG